MSLYDVYVSVSISICISTQYQCRLPVYLSIYLCSSLYAALCITFASMCLRIYPCVYVSILVSMYLSMCLRIYLCVYVSIHVSTYSIYPCVYVSIHVSMYLSMCLRIYPCVDQSLHQSLPEGNRVAPGWKRRRPGAKTTTAVVTVKTNG